MINLHILLIPFFNISVASFLIILSCGIFTVMSTPFNNLVYLHHKQIAQKSKRNDLLVYTFPKTLDVTLGRGIGASESPMSIKQNIEIRQTNSFFFFFSFYVFTFQHVLDQNGTFSDIPVDLELIVIWTQKMYTHIIFVIVFIFFYDLKGKKKATTLEKLFKTISGIVIGWRLVRRVACTA